MSSPDSPASPLHKLAEAAGLAITWEDVHQRIHQVDDDSLEALLEAMGFECGGAARIECSLRRLLEEESHHEGGMLVAEVDHPIVFRHAGSMRYRLEFESGGDGLRHDAQRLSDGYIRLDPVIEPGYHRLWLDGRELTLAVAPKRCHLPGASRSGGLSWGVAAQVYSLQGQYPSNASPLLHAAQGAGDYSLLAKLAYQAAEQGADALAISPVHALFSADPSRYSPYAPSSRLFLNTAYLDVQALGNDPLREAMAALAPDVAQAATSSAGADTSLIDWQTVHKARLQLTRALFEHFETHAAEAERKSFEAFWIQGGDALQNHCLYEVLHAHYSKTLGVSSGWQDWPAPMHDPTAAAVQAFARGNATELRFYAFMQWLADRGLSDAQQAALDAGMSIGLITDLAIGADARGSQAWSAPQSLVQGATVGAAPDLYYPQGQNWGLTAFSPRALQTTGFRPFLSMLRSVLAHAGGVRIDHVLGMARMWLVPENRSAADGAFLRYPLTDMLRLLALESERHKAVVIGENLGTVPEGFNEQLYDKGIMGTSVLWFEREKEAPQRFIGIKNWPRVSVATTTTHDLPTVAGWWRQRDIDWQHKLGRISEAAEQEARNQREQDKALLCDAMQTEDSCTVKETPPPVAEILGWVASAPSLLSVFPLEDILALPEQPNLPGPIDEGELAHPNWLRRLPVSVDELFDDFNAQRAVQAISQARSGS